MNAVREILSRFAFVLFLILLTHTAAEHGQVASTEIVAMAILGGAFIFLGLLED